MITWPQTALELRNLLGITPSPTLQCHGTTSKSATCKVKISKDNSSTIEMILSEIIGMKGASSVSHLLVKLAALVVCKRFHQKQTQTILQRWEKSLPVPVDSDEEEDSDYREDSDDEEYSDDRENFQSRFADDVDHDIQAVPPEEPRDQEMKDEPSQVKMESPPTSLQAKTIKIKSEAEDIIDLTSIHPYLAQPSHPTTKDSSTQTSPTPTAPVQPPSTPGDKHSFEPFGPSKTTLQLNQSIKTLISRKLLPTEMPSPGSIYVYTFPTRYSFRAPHLKIGYAKDVKERMARWQRQCGYEPSLLGDFPASLYVKIEKLVHAQLHNQRQKETCCPTCGSCHREWFQVKTPRASELISLWTAWSRQHPYDEEGCLKKEWVDRLSKVDLTDPECWDDFVFVE